MRARSSSRMPVISPRQVLGTGDTSLRPRRGPEYVLRTRTPPEGGPTCGTKHMFYLPCWPILSSRGPTESSLPIGVVDRVISCIVTVLPPRSPRPGQPPELRFHRRWRRRLRRTGHPLRRSLNCSHTCSGPSTPFDFSVVAPLPPDSGSPPECRPEPSSFGLHGYASSRSRQILWRRRPDA